MRNDPYTHRQTTCMRYDDYMHRHDYYMGPDHIRKDYTRG